MLRIRDKKFQRQDLRVRVMKILEFGVRLSKNRYEVKVKVDNKAKKHLRSNTIWLKIAKLARTGYLHKKCMEAICTNVRQAKHRRNLQFIAIGAGRTNRRRTKPKSRDKTYTGPRITPEPRELPARRGPNTRYQTK